MVKVETQQLSIVVGEVWLWKGNVDMYELEILQIIHGHLDNKETTIKVKNLSLGGQVEYKSKSQFADNLQAKLGYHTEIKTKFLGLIPITRREFIKL